ncbi:hypothetical protein BJ912DRAFT_821110, partial [Pholiota molesta]
QSLSALTMAPPLSKDLRDQVVMWRTKYHWPYRKLADVAGCSIGTIATILKYSNTYGTSINPFGHHLGRPRLLDAEDCTYIDTLLESQPTIYLDEIHAKLVED